MANLQTKDRTKTAKQIPLVEPLFPEAYAQEVKEQILSGFIGPGARTKEFASQLSKYVRAQDCLLTVSGTIALTVAAKALDLKPEDEILLPAYGVISTISAFASIGLSPRLVEIEKQTGCISAQNLNAALTPKTKAVCFVNFSGYTGPNLLEVRDLCAQKGLPLIEDAAGALGQQYQRRYAGTFGTVGIYSFSVPKVITTGQGGALVTGNRELFLKAAAYIDHGDLEWRKTNLNHDIGTNLRYTDIQAALGIAQLQDIESRLALRRSSYTTLKSQLGDALYSIPSTEAPLHNIVFTQQPNQLIQHLAQHGITAVRQYRTLSQHPAYKHLANANYPNSDFWTDCAVYLPFGMALAPEDSQYIADTVLSSGTTLLPISSAT